MKLKEWMQWVVQSSPAKLRRSPLEYARWTPGAIAAVLSVGLWQLGMWQPLERLGYNLLFQIRELLPHPSWDSRLVVIAIDDATLQQYGQFPLPRDRYTQLLQILQASQPAAIGFDILFAEPTAQDRSLAQAMADHGNVVLAIAGNRQKRTLQLVTSLAKVTAQGHILTSPEPDGIHRQVNLYINGFPALSVELIQAYNQSLTQVIRPEGQQPALLPIVLPLMIATVPEQRAWINWPGPTQGPESVPTYSLADVLRGQVEPQAFANKIVLVGTTATGEDTLRTPLEQQAPTAGVYLHAAALDNLMNHRFLWRLPDWAEILLLGLIGISSSVVLFPLRFGQRTGAALVLPVAWGAIAMTAFVQSHLWLPTLAPISTFLLAGLGMQMLEQREKQLMMNLFARHVSPETATLIWQHRAEIFQQGQLEAQEMIATMLFSDIRNFTSVSETMSPRELLDWLNLYLNAMTECIHEHHGVVDKYIGDAIMAVFGVPFPHIEPAAIQQDALNAVSAAIAMQQRLITLNQELEQAGMPSIRAGIGIHTGLVIAGSIGGTQRMNYSILGDAVNVAARLEPLNKQMTLTNCYDILVSEQTFTHVSASIAGYPVQTLQLRGRQQNTVIYAIAKSDVVPKDVAPRAVAPDKADPSEPGC
jgi:adenylate cyclase